MGSNAKVAIACAEEGEQPRLAVAQWEGDADDDEEGGGSVMGGGSAGNGGIDEVAGSTGLGIDPAGLAMEGIEASSVEIPADRLDSPDLIRRIHL